MIEITKEITFEGLNYHRICKSDVLSHMTKDIQHKLGADSRDVAKSMIHPDYADRFIREFVFDGDFKYERNS